MAKNKLISVIDIGSSKIATILAQVREDDQERLHIIGASIVASKGVKKGQIVDIAEAVEAIEESVEAAERMAGYNVGSVWVTVGGAKISSQNSQGVVAVTQPQGEIVSEDVKRVTEAARAISLPPASEIIHVIPRSYKVDGQDGIKDPIGMSGIRLEVDSHIVTGSTIDIKNIKRCISDVGCDLSGMVFDGLASGTATLSDTEKELGAVLVDIGGGTTSIAIFIDGALAYSSVLPVGAKNVTADLAAGLRVSLESAEKIKVYLGANKYKDDDVDLTSLNLPEETKTISFKTLVDGIIKIRLNEMFQAVAAEIKKSNFAGLTPSGIILTGGGALTVGALESAKRTLVMPVRIGVPIGISGLIDDVDGPAFAGVIGLAKIARDGKGEEKSGTSWMPKLSFTGQFSKVGQLLKSLLP
jgi:cell division protein FtsA